MKIHYKDKIFETEEQKTVYELLEYEIKNNEYMVVAAIFNNTYVSLDYKLTEDGTIEFVDVSSKAGRRVYVRTLMFVLAKAVEELYPEAMMTINYQLKNAMFCDFKNMEVTDEFLKNVTNRMQEIINDNLPINQVIMNYEEAEAFYKDKNTTRGKLQLDVKNNNEIYLYTCEDYFNYCYGVVANKTGVLKIFELVKYDDGFLVRYPNASNPRQLPKLEHTKKIAWALNEYDDIHKILKINTVYKLNRALEEGKMKDIIMIDEALHEKKIANIADDIAKNKDIKMILIAGPSSSGKTTFAQRLGIQLRINRIKPVTISVDNYFVERKDTPLGEDGKYDFECLEAIDIDLFNDHLTKLLNGEEVEMPEFDFKDGTKKYNGKKLKLNTDEVLVVEGIHCLNDKLTSKIPAFQKYKIYISALTVLNLDYHTRISSSDTRLLRRMVRDYQFRSYSAKETIANWPMVNRGEEKNIFPFQESANAIFNTSLIYELGVLKGFALPILEKITSEEKEHAEAVRLINLLKYIDTIPAEYVPTNSLLKEFIGGGNFKY